MTTPFEHGRYTFQLPDGYEDRSTLMFVAKQDMQAPMSLKASPRSAPPNLVVTFVRPVPAGPVAAYLLEQATTTVAPILPAFSIVSRGGGESDAEPVAFVSYSGNPGQPIRQIIAGRVVGDALVLVTGGALEAQFPAVERQALALVTSVAPR